MKSIFKMIFQKVMSACFLANLLMLSTPVFSSNYFNEIDEEKFYAKQATRTSQENSGNYDYKNISQAIGYEFKNNELLLQALTRRSALNEGLQGSKKGDFQRLEFIGDRVLNLVISDILFDNHPDWNEGQLTSELNKFTHNKGPLASISKKLGLGKFLIIGSGEEKLNIRDNTKVLSDACEALIGAIWIDTDNNYAFIKGFIREQFKVLGLIDFNDEYKKQTIKFAYKKMYNEIIEDIGPELYGESGGGYMTIGEILRYNKLKKQATKPLIGLAADFEKSLHSYSDDSDNDQNLEVSEF